MTSYIYHISYIYIIYISYINYYYSCYLVLVDCDISSMVNNFRYHYLQSLVFLEDGPVPTLF